MEKHQKIFLTGATGYLGAYLLHDLLRATDSTLYCLVRAANHEEAKKRIQKNLERYLLWKPEDASRIFPVIGDLAQPLFGLTDEQFQKLAGEIDVIYHNGAWVNWILPYPVLKDTNVGGTQETLRLACAQKMKPVHYLSTNGIFISTEYEHTKYIDEDEELHQSKGIFIGYAQSKWVAERVIQLGRERGVPISIYRPGILMGDSQSGIFNLDDFLCKLIKGCIQLGFAPDLELPAQITPVDFVSKSIVYLSNQTENLGKTFHVITPDPIYWNRLVDWINYYGYPIEKMPYKEWRKRMIERVRAAQNHALFDLLPFFELMSEGRLKIPNFACKKTFQALKGSKISCPAINSKLLKTYFSYFIRSGFLEPPKPEHKPNLLQIGWKAIRERIT